MRDGTMVARQCTAHYQIGAYADVGPRVVQKAGYTACGPYRIPHVQIDTYAVYSNTVNSVAFRGYGVPQLAWASTAECIAANAARPWVAWPPFGR
jgi:CO/xanthine dehydrogenase Mo-binding subunit